MRSPLLAFSVIAVAAASASASPNLQQEETRIHDPILISPRGDDTSGPRVYAPSPPGFPTPPEAEDAVQTAEKSTAGGVSFSKPSIAHGLSGEQHDVTSADGAPATGPNILNYNVDDGPIEDDYYGWRHHGDDHHSNHLGKNGHRHKGKETDGPGPYGGEGDSGDTGSARGGCVYNCDDRGCKTYCPQGRWHHGHRGHKGGHQRRRHGGNVVYSDWTYYPS